MMHDDECFLWLLYCYFSTTNVTLLYLDRIYYRNVKFISFFNALRGWKRKGRRKHMKHETTTGCIISVNVIFMAYCRPFSCKSVLCMCNMMHFLWKFYSLLGRLVDHQYSFDIKYYIKKFHVWKRISNVFK